MITVIELAKALVAYDDDHDCRLCLKQSWGTENHDPDCPMAMAYKVIEESENEEN